VDTSRSSLPQLYQKNNQVVEFSRMSNSVLFTSKHNDNDNPVPTSSLMTSSLDSASGATENIDWDALERKNSSRKKFGLDPLTPEQFLELQKQVEELSIQQQQRAAAMAADLADKKRKERGNFLKKIFKNVVENTCETNYDCERPQVCCDLGFKKMCCSSGMRVIDGPRSRYGQLAEVPVIANPNPYPQANNRGRSGGYGRY